MRWDPKLYSRFADFRGRPFHELAARIDTTNPAKVVDLGSGPGELTASLAKRWPQAQILGLDGSAEMVEKARSSNYGPNVHFEQADASTFSATDVDVLITNAMLQWIPEHPQLISRWSQELKPGAWIAFQVPGNFRAPSHALMRELAASETWRDKLAGVLRGPESVLDPAQYLSLVAEAGCIADAWETTYYQVLQGHDPVLEWVRGTALRPVMHALSEDDFQAFESEYAQMLREAYPAADFGTVFPFRRQFVVGFKPSPTA